MRQALNDVAFRGRVVIGEGEIDHAPMLWIGEEVGKGDGPEVDIAVDPIEGTRMVAMGQSNALAVMAFAPRDSLLHAPDMYMKKLVVNRLAAGAIDSVFASGGQLAQRGAGVRQTAGQAAHGYAG